jgi:hypothetical protein
MTLPPKITKKNLFTRIAQNTIHEARSAVDNKRPHLATPDQWLQLSFPHHGPALCIPTDQLFGATPVNESTNNTISNPVDKCQRTNNAVPPPIQGPAAHIQDLPPIGEIPVPVVKSPTNIPRRTSTRTKTPRDLLHPTHKGKVYKIERLPGKQRVPFLLVYPGKERVFPKEIRVRRYQKSTTSAKKDASSGKSTYHQVYGWSDMFKNMSKMDVQRLFTKFQKVQRKHTTTTAYGTFDKPMPKPDLPPVFPTRPLNLNEDGSSISYRKAMKDRMSNIGSKPMPKKLNVCSHRALYDHSSCKTYRQIELPHMSTLFAAKS